MFDSPRTPWWVSTASELRPKPANVFRYRFAIRNRNGLSNLNSAPNTPAIDKGSRKSRVEEVNGERAIHDARGSRGCHCPGASTAIRVEPCRHLIELAAESVR